MSSHTCYVFQPSVPPQPPLSRSFRPRPYPLCTQGQPARPPCCSGNTEAIATARCTELQENGDIQNAMANDDGALWYFMLLLLLPLAALAAGVAAYCRHVNKTEDRTISEALQYEAPPPLLTGGAGPVYVPWSAPTPAYPPPAAPPVPGPAYAYVPTVAAPVVSAPVGPAYPEEAAPAVVYQAPWV